MTDDKTQSQIKGPVSLIKSSWKMFEIHWKTLIPIVIAPAVLFYAGMIFNTADTLWRVIPVFVLMMLGIIYGIAMQPAALNAIGRLSAEPGAAISFKEQYEIGFKYFWSVIFLSILSVLIYFGASVFLLIPAIIVLFYSSLYMFPLVFEGKKGFDALSESFNLVKGRFWKFFGRMIFLAAIFIVGQMIINIINPPL
jgi:hypothetical protein